MTGRFDLFQWIVDASQRQPYWWCRQCAILAALTFIAYKAFKAEPLTGWVVISFAIGSLMHFLMIRFSASASLLARHCQMAAAFRWFFWGIAVFSLMKVEGASGAALLVNSIATAAFFSFAVCRPPAPPKTKTSPRLAFGGGT